MKNLIQLIVMWFLFTLVFCLGYLLGTPKTEPKPYYVTDKYEHNGKCYVQTWIEVDVSDYIGLEVGDEFEVAK